MSELGGSSRILYKQSFVPSTPYLTLGCPTGNPTAGSWYSASLGVNGGVAPYHLSYSGQLPAGITLDPISGNLYGIPAASNVGYTSSFTVTAKDSTGATQTSSCNMTVGKAAAATALKLSCGLGGAQAQEWFDVLLGAQGGTPPYKFSITGSLPAGLTFNTVEGSISGIPSAATNGAVSVTVGVTDSKGASSNQVCKVSVGAALPAHPDSTSDQFGHGTHVAGIIGSTGLAGTGSPLYVGIAPDVNFVSLKVLDQNGAGTDASVLAGIE
jgi:subtilisin family serine protease